MPRPILLLLCLIFIGISCKTSQKSNEESIKIEQAIWYNWAGGMAGVGGTNYEVSVLLPGVSEAVASKLVIDGKSVEISRFELIDGKLDVFAVENQSQRDEVADPMNKRPKFRKTNPERAQLHLVLDGKQSTLEVSGFEQSDTKNYQ